MRKVSSGWVAIAAIIGLAIIFGGVAFTLHKVNEYEETRYHTESNTTGIDVYAFFLKAKKDCAEQENATDSQRCHETVDRVIKRHIGSRDLIAQETVALATRGLLWVGAIQTITGFFTLGFLGWTVYQTYMILEQARATDKHAESALSVSSRTAEFEYQPYFSVEIGQSLFLDGIHGYSLAINIRNEGRSAATNITVEFIAAGSQIQGIEEENRIVGRSPLISNDWRSEHIKIFNGKIFVKCPIIGPEKQREVIFSFPVEPITTIETRHRTGDILLKGFAIRYEDFTCKNSGRHKVAIGDLSRSQETGDGSVYIYDIETDENKNKPF